jgi:type II secretory pathway predicted ATPase ExeA
MPQEKKTTAPKKEPPIYSDYDTARQKLSLAIETGPFYGLLLGPSGSGKSSLLREVASRLDRHRFQVLYLAQSKASSSGLGRFLMGALRLTSRRSHAESLHVLSETIRALPFRLLVFADEANLLGEESLQELRLMAESLLDSPLLFSVVLAGLPELKVKLQAPALFPLRRRISLWLELRGLKEDEVAPFLRQRFPDSRLGDLPPEALGLIFERARGIPALIEDIARRLLSATGRDLPTIERLTEILDTCDF